jgi:serine/threonine protein kinase
MFHSSLLHKIGYKYIPIEKLSSNESSDIYSVHSSPYEIQILILFNKGFTEEKFAKQLEIYSRISQNKSSYFFKYISNSKDELIVREKYIVLEFTRKDELKKYILSGKFFSEKLAKIIIKKIIDGISEIHKMGIIHKKISVDNIFFDGFFNFKIGGFDNAEIVGQNNNKKLFKQDIYCLGMILIQLLAGKPEIKVIKDKLKLAIKKGNFNSFWKIIESQGEYKFTKELKDLVNQMMSGQILDIQKLLNNKWFDEVQNIDKKQYELYEQFMNKELKKYETEENEVAV